MHRTPSLALALAILIAGLALPVTIVRAQTPSASPTPEGYCVPADTDPTEGNAIEFERLAGPPDKRGDGPSLYQVTFTDAMAHYFPGCDADAEAVYVSSGPVYLEGFDDLTTGVFFANGVPEGFTCDPIAEQPDHEPRTGCILKPHTIVKLDKGSSVFHEKGAQYEYAGSPEALPHARRSGLINAMSAGVLAPSQADAVGSILISSPNAKPYGCGGECK